MWHSCAIIIFTNAFCLSAFSGDKIDSILYKHAQKAPHTSDVITLVEYLEEAASDEKQKVTIFFYWIAQNIEYDVDLYNQNLSWADVSPYSVLSRKQTICSGYSNLFYEMCAMADIECVIVNGIAQTFLDDQKRIQIDSVNHAWNAVSVEGNWKLIDCTWGSGDVLVNKYIKEIDLRYLLADPDFLIVDHFPVDPQWQLLKTPISILEFQSKEWKERRYQKWQENLQFR